MVAPAPLSPAQVRSALDQLLGVDDSVSLTHHCRTQAGRRNFDVFDIESALKNGLPAVDEWSDEHQEWKYKVTGTDVDGDSLTVVVVLDEENATIKVITGY